MKRPTKLHKPRDPFFTEMTKRKSGVHSEDTKKGRNKAKRRENKRKERIYDW